MSAPRAKAKPCPKRAQLRQIIAREEQGQGPLLAAYIEQKEEAKAIAEALRRMNGRGEPIPLPSDSLPVLG